MPDDRIGLRRRGVHVSSCWEVFRCLVFRRCFGAVGLHKVGCGRSVSSSRSCRGGDADWYVWVCVLWEAIDARDGGGRDRVYEERRCFAAFSVCKAFTFTAQGRGGAGRCFMPTSGVRLPSCRYALREDRTAREADGVRFALARTSCSGRVREDVGLWLKGLVVECRCGCARCRDASEGACHNQQADGVGFHVRLHLRLSVSTSRA